MDPMISAPSSRLMSAARRNDGLLPAQQTLALLDLMARRDDGALEDQILRDLAATIQISWSRARNTIRMLTAFGLISEEGGRIAVAVKPTAGLGAIRETIAKRSAAEMIRRIEDHEGWTCLKTHLPDGSITVDSMILPAMADGLGLWIIDFGIASRDAVQSRHWSITKEYKGVFERAAREANSKRPRRAKSAAQLEQDLVAQAAAGILAEEWVLAFERRRLASHPLRDLIRRVSENDVAAGYDIVSFSGPTSIHHDRFIEVKSYGEVKRFFWTRNEIATAKEFGEQYCLYLVDRRRIEEPGYSPHIISGPTPEMFGAEGSGWSVSATSFEHVALGLE
jgi:hypothetical protein